MNNISIIIPVHNSLKYTKQCLKNIYNCIDDTNIDDIYVIVIDDGSTDKTNEWIKNNYQSVILLQGSGNLWWGGGINMGVEYVINNNLSDYVLLWNNDVTMDQHYIKNIIKICKCHDENTIIGSKVLYKSKHNIIWSFGGYLNKIFGFRKLIYNNKNDSVTKNELLEVDWLTGMGTVVPINIVKNIGYWDSDNFPQYICDLEFTYRAKTNGFKLIVDPSLKLWNDTDNSKSSLNMSFLDYLRSYFSLYSNRSYAIEIKFMKMYNHFPLGLVGYGQRILFSVVRYFVFRLKSII